MAKRDDFWTDEKLLPASAKKDLGTAEIRSEMPSSSLPDTPARTLYESGLFHPLEVAAGETVSLGEKSRILIAATVTFPGYERMAFRGYREKALASHRTSPKTEAPYRSFYTVMPRYESLSREQFRYYLTWRERVRSGAYMQVDFGYLYLYLYELLNLVGEIPPKEVLAALIALWRAYRKDFPMLDRQLGDWILDLCILWRLPLPAEEILDIFCEGEPKTLPLSATCGVVDGLFSGTLPLTPPRKELLLRRLCSYRFRQSRYYREDGRFADRMEALIDEILPKLIASGILLPAEPSAKMKITRFAFSGAVISAERRRTIELECYTNWGEETAALALGDAIKVLDNALRTRFGIRSRLSGMHLPEHIVNMITGIVCDEAPVKIPVKTPLLPKRAEVDPQKARSMESSAWETTRLLTAYLHEEDAVPSEKTEAEVLKQETVIPPATSGPFAALSSDELAALLLLAKKDAEGVRRLAKKNRLFVDALVDCINEKLLDDYGEPICDEQGVYDEYADEIISALNTKGERS